MTEPTSRDLYQQLLRGEVDARAYTDAVRREVREQVRARPYKPRKHRPRWRFWGLGGRNE